MRSRTAASLVLAAVVSTASSAAQGLPRAFEVASIKPQQVGRSRRRRPGVRARRHLGTQPFAGGAAHHGARRAAGSGRQRAGMGDERTLRRAMRRSAQTWSLVRRRCSGRCSSICSKIGFSSRWHHETRQLNVYRSALLRADRLGAKLTPAAIDACEAPAQSDAASLRAAATRCQAGPVPGGISVHGMPIATLASLMGSSAGRVIVDATGLAGNWDLDLTFVDQVQSSNADGPSLFAALQEQLGLKLEPGRAPVDVVVIDRLDRPSED